MANPMLDVYSVIRATFPHANGRDSISTRVRIAEWSKHPESGTFEVRYEVIPDGYEPNSTHEVIPLAHDTPACNLARAILADPGDAVKWGVLLDAVQEAFHVAPDLERAKAMFESDLLVAMSDGQVLDILIQKLCDLGYGDVLDRCIVRPTNAGRPFLMYDLQNETLDRPQLP